jgi:hypothetical protein
VDGGVSVEHFEYNLTSSRSVDIKVDAETITIEGSNDGSGVVRVSDIARVFLWQTSGARTLHLLSRDGRIIGLGAIKRSSDPSNAGWQTFHAAAASILRGVASSNAVLAVELGPSPKSQKLMPTMVAIGGVCVTALQLIVSPPGSAPMANYAPMAGLAALIGVFLWNTWLRKFDRAAPAQLASHLASTPASLNPKVP